jgi:hypothetical protein
MVAPANLVACQCVFGAFILHMCDVRSCIYASSSCFSCQPHAKQQSETWPAMFWRSLLFLGDSGPRPNTPYAVIL